MYSYTKQLPILITKIDLARQLLRVYGTGHAPIPNKKADCEVL